MAERNLVCIQLIFSDGSVQTVPIAAAAQNPALPETAPAEPAGSAKMQQVLAVLRLTYQTLRAKQITGDAQQAVRPVFMQAVKQVSTERGISIQSIQQSFTRASNISLFSEWVEAIAEERCGNPEILIGLCRKCCGKRTFQEDTAAIQEFLKELGCSGNE